MFHSRLEKWYSSGNWLGFFVSCDSKRMTMGIVNRYFLFMTKFKDLLERVEDVILIEETMLPKVIGFAEM
jgi:hypothetical protein